MKQPSLLFRIFSAALLLTPFLGMSQAKNIDAADFEKGISRSNVQVLDVRTQREYNSGHIRNAFLADWTDKTSFQQRVQYLDKTKPVYTYCLSGGRSNAAATWLKENGFLEVYNLDGGMLAWKKSEKPVEEASVVKQISQEEFFADSIPTDQTVLVDISASWCPPCKKMEPVVQELLQSANGAFKVVQIDGSEQESLSKELQANSFPTFIVYKNGKETWRKEGVVEKKELLEHMK